MLYDYDGILVLLYVVETVYLYHQRTQVILLYFQALFVLLMTLVKALLAFVDLGQVEP